MRRSHVFLAIAAGAALSIAMACGSSSESTVASGGAGHGAANTGGAGTIIITGGTTGAAADSGIGNGGSGNTCAADSYQGERVPLDMFIMMDKSGSMSGENGQNGGNNVWIPITNAIKSFVESPQSAGIGVGLGYFPIEATSCRAGDTTCDCTTVATQCSSCKLVDYATPSVPIALLPGVGAAIVDSLNAHSPGGATPTQPALSGALEYAQAHQKADPIRKVIVVLATDGQPNDCNSNVTNVSTAARTAAAAIPPIKTFVIGIGNTGNLNDIANAGGTGQALIVNSASAGQDFLDAMNAIRGAALTCEFTIPTPRNGETLDPNLVNVVFTPKTGTGGTIFYKVNDASACDPTLGGWYYDDNSNPTRILLCDSSCNAIKGTDGNLDILLRCPSQAPPPPA